MPGARVSLRWRLGGLASLVAGIWAASARATPTGAAVTPAQAPSAAAAPPTEREPPVRDSGSQLRAYYQALAERRLDASSQLSVEKLRGIIQSAEGQLGIGRRDEAIALMAGVVESPRFTPLKDLEEGRAAVFMLGDALGRAGAYPLARDYLLRLLEGGRVDTWYRRAVSSLVDFGLASGDAEAFLPALSKLPAGVEEAWAADVAYLRGMQHETAGRLPDALTAYAAVTPRSRFWAQATYRSGLIEVERHELAAGEQHFCKLADPRQTPKLAPLFGGNAFFQTRDLSRLALGRVAHEQYRFDDARYYYHLVPGDSDRLPEALYESATSRYEAKDYEAAHRLLNELRSLERPHPYADEVWILDAYVDLGQCEFGRADAKLKEFLKRYEPVLEAARRLESDPRALGSLIEGGHGTDAQGAMGIGSPREVADLLVSAIRVDPAYGTVTRQLADLDHQLSGLDSAREALAELKQRAGDPDAVKARPVQARADSPADRWKRFAQQTASLRRMLREASVGAGSSVPDLPKLKQELIQLEADAAALDAQPKPASAPAAGVAAGGSLEQLLQADAEGVLELASAGRALRAALLEQRHQLARQALERLERRLTRLVRRARTGRIETVLGRKQALELEIEALSQGFLPPGAVDSLDAARYLSDDEEYWPFDGEDWEDEYVGGEGLR